MPYTTLPLDIDIKLERFCLQYEHELSFTRQCSSPITSTRLARYDDKQAPHKRSRVSKACHRCRVRKVKCDGGKPCVRCIEVDDICNYTRFPQGCDTKEYSQSYVDLLLDQNKAYKTALRILYMYCEHNIPLHNPTMPSMDGKHIPFVHEILDHVGRLDKGEEVEKQRDATMGQNYVQAFGSADIVSNMIDLVAVASPLDLEANKTSPALQIESSFANTVCDEYDKSFRCCDAYSDPYSTHNFRWYDGHGNSSLEFDIGLDGLMDVGGI